VNLVDGKTNRRIQTRVHCLVASTFIGERPDGCDIMHLDGNKTNPNLSNLRYGSRSCNEAFKIDHGTALIGENHHQAKLKERDVLEIRRQLKNGVRGVVLADRYNITPSAICSIKRGRSWQSV
jgi:hypothetical protein